VALAGFGVKFLLEARRTGVSFERTATIGRQKIGVDPGRLQRILERYQVGITIGEANRILEEADGFCEPLLRVLGATQVTSLDASPYQVASVLHDMNTPIPQDLTDRFSVVLDGGSLEHVFNFPRAIANCMQMLHVGGRFLGINPANNFMGHGFYQFSPELYFRVFGPQNGFVTERMLAYEDCWPFYDWYEVRDPADVRQRVTLVNRHPTFLMVQSRKTASVPLFERFPQQSDYVEMWAGGAQTVSSAGPRPAMNETGESDSALRKVRDGLVALLPPGWRHRYHRWRAGPSPFNPEFYRKLEE
jgi:SAM-dependent methyltransferase